MRSFIVPSAAFARCPTTIMTAEHFREDGSCLCDRYDRWSDADLAALIEARLADVTRHRILLAEALRKLASAATSDAGTVDLGVPPEALVLQSLPATDVVRRARDDLSDARDRLAAAATERNRREGTIP